ncbi:transthyretin domain-containing protein [Ascosphaera apis ARSEF 7405]|uniref:Transthyretin domain-containing protein n=1 Tax=Ascosphaera apis ARSEF 7405 TaxID=392613 RepID=A0A167WHZ2_9EURO|nr:transthyretin domain-containing protein [Ascosphaera apis ARSEF 7405]
MTDHHRDHITCHVLNTHNGTPGANLPCYLTIHSITSNRGKLDISNETIFDANALPLRFAATTNQDGRVSSWSALPSSSSDENGQGRGQGTSFRSFSEYISSTFTTPEAKESLRFVVSVKIAGVDEFYRAQGVESFWPEVEVKFVVKGWEGAKGWRHYHVPVLLGPWSYSTYRGS